MIYRFKIWFEEEDDIFRVIDITPSSSFLQFHDIILDSIGFKKDLPSAFYSSEDNWRKGKEIHSVEGKFLMENIKLKDQVNDPHQKFVYITDFNEQWTLHIELQSIQNEVGGLTYPIVFKSVGKAPKQNEGLSRFKTIDENEFDEIANKLVSQHAPMVDVDVDFDEEGFSEGGDDADAIDDVGEAFGSGDDDN
jgi:hypothetical protein